MRRGHFVASASISTESILGGTQTAKLNSCLGWTTLAKGAISLRTISSKRGSRYSSMSDHVMREVELVLSDQSKAKSHEARASTDRPCLRKISSRAVMSG